MQKFISASRAVDLAAYRRGVTPADLTLSEARDLLTVVNETLGANASERQGRISDGEDGGSLEQKKREGYF